MKTLVDICPDFPEWPDRWHGMPVRIGVGKPHWIAAPLPPNRTGGSPASGSPVDGSPQRGPAKPGDGRVQSLPSLERPFALRTGLFLRTGSPAMFFDRNLRRFGHPAPTPVYRARGQAAGIEVQDRFVPAERTFHLPGALRSPGVTRLRRYDGSSDSCPATLRTGRFPREFGT